MKLTLRGNRIRLCIVLLLFGASLAYGATVTVPSLELFTKAGINSSGVILQSEGKIDLLVEGGYKFGGSMVLGFLSNNLEQDLTNRIAIGQSEGGTLTFKSASIIIQTLFGLPVSFSYFHGQNDIFASGDGFSDIFGTEPVSTQYSGFLYFSEGIRYDGIHRVAGTGIRLQLNPVKERFSSALYLYQDGYFYNEIPPLPSGEYEFDPGHYSMDWRTMMNLEKIKLEIFLGATLPAATYGYYRGGFLFHAKEKSGEFLAQLGIPRWDPVNDAFGLDLFHLLFEARLNLGFIGIIPTVFLHPGYYLQRSTGEGGLIDFNLNLRLGNPEKTLTNGGIEANLAFDDQNMQDFEIKLSPYLNLVTPGVLWQLKMNVSLLPWTPSEMFEGFIGIKAVF